MYVATVVGPYFNWGLESDATDFKVYAGHYKTLKSLVELPKPSGVVYDYTDPFGKPAKLQTMLTSPDGDLALEFHPVTVIGTKISATLLAEIEKKALEAQGDLGPTKTVSARWFLIAESLVTKLGGLPNVTSALKAYQSDESIFGKFSLPKNLIMFVQVVSDDGTRLVSRDLETGMPTGYGNVLVGQKLRLSIQSGKPLPLTAQNMMGAFSGSYVATSATTARVQYSDMSTAGGVLGIVYEKDPNYKQPDPNSPDCTTAPADHVGLIRYRMCTQQYRKSTIKVDDNGAYLIMTTVRNETTGRLPVMSGWLFLGFIVALCVFTFVAKSGMLQSY